MLLGGRTPGSGRGRKSLVWPRASEDTESADLSVVWEVAVSGSARECANEMIYVHELITVHGHHLYAVSDHSDGGEEAVEALRREGFADKDIWVFRGEEGSRRLGVTGRWHRLRARCFRRLQFAMSRDFRYLRAYLRALDLALDQGHIVIAVRVSDVRVADDVGRLLRMHAGHSIAYCSHWGVEPVAA